MEMTQIIELLKKKAAEHCEEYELLQGNDIELARRCLHDYLLTLDILNEITGKSFIYVDGKWFIEH